MKHKIVIISFGSLLLKRRKSTKTITNYLVKLYQTTWKVFELVLDQEDFKNSRLFANFLWLLLCFLLLVVITGFFLNMMSSDLVALKPGNNINELRDLLKGGTFAHSNPVILKILYFYEYLLKSTTGSPLQQLYQKMADFEKDNCRHMSTCSFVDFDMSQSHKMLEILEYVTSLLGDDTRSRCFLFNRQYFESALSRLACMYRPSMFLMAHVSHQAIVSDILVLFYNRHRATWMLRERIDYLTMSRLEFGYVPTTMTKLATAVAEQVNFQYDWKAQKCMAKFEDDPKPNSYPPLWWLRKTSLICTGLLAIGTVCLIVELIAYRYYRYKQRQSSRLFSKSIGKRQSLLIKRDQ